MTNCFGAREGAPAFDPDYSDESAGLVQSDHERAVATMRKLRLQNGATEDAENEAQRLFALAQAGEDRIRSALAADGGPQRYTEDAPEGFAAAMQERLAWSQGMQGHAVRWDERASRELHERERKASIVAAMIQSGAPL